MTKREPGSMPAFPAPAGCSDETGITLRDYFAAAALQGLIANKAHPTTFKNEDDANYCYAIAEAMLEARK